MKQGCSQQPTVGPQPARRAAWRCRPGDSVRDRLAGLVIGTRGPAGPGKDLRRRPEHARRRGDRPRPRGARRPRHRRPIPAKSRRRRRRRSPSAVSRRRVAARPVPTARPDQAGELLVGDADHHPADGPLAGAGDPDHDDQLHADHHRPVAAAAGAGHAAAAAQPGADRAGHVHDLPDHGPDLAEGERRRPSSPTWTARSSQPEALTPAQGPVRDFMIAQIRTSGNDEDVDLFTEFAHEPPPKNWGEVKTTTLIPAFMLSELKTAFLLGLQGLPAVPDHRHGDFDGADQHGHDDAAAGDDFAAVQVAVVRSGQRMALDYREPDG